MTFLIEVTYPDHQNVSVSDEYKPKRFVESEPEDAMQVFERESQPEPIDRNRVVEGLTVGFHFKTTDRETGRTVTAKQIPEGCSVCEREHHSTDPGWSLVKAGFLCPDCTVAVCPDDRSAVGAVV